MTEDRRVLASPRLDGSARRVVDALRSNGPLARADLSTATGLSRATIANIVSELRTEGLLVEIDDRRPRDNTGATMGRPPQLVALDRHAGIAVGIDLGKHEIRVAVADLSHEVLAERARATRPDIPAVDRIDQAAALLDETLSEVGIDRDSIVGVGIAVPAPLQPDTSQFRSSTILPGWVGLPIRAQVEQRINLPVVVGNDVNLGALAEHTWGVSRDESNFIYLKWGADIGCGLVIDGRLYEGPGGLAGEIGHVVADEKGAFCRCGNRGCIETVAGTRALLAAVAPAVGELTETEMIERTVAGDPTCRRAFVDAGRALGSALATAVTIFNPSMLVLGGSAAHIGDEILDVVADQIAARTMPAVSDDLTLRASSMSDRAEVLGAIAAVLRSTGLGIAPRVR